MNTYYFAIASRKFLTEKEPLEEILRERVSYYKTHNKTIDFWFVETPEFFEAPQFKTITGNNKSTFAGIVSTNRIFINWLKLRVGYIATGQLNESEFVANKLLENIVTTK
nr:Ycf54 [Porphyrostromium boryanum]